MQEPPGHFALVRFASQTVGPLLHPGAGAEELGLDAEEPQGGSCSEPSAPTPVLFLAVWANDLLGNQQTTWKPC